MKENESLRAQVASLVITKVSSSTELRDKIPGLGYNSGNSSVLHSSPIVSALHDRISALVLVTKILVYYVCSFATGRHAQSS
jgi:hypothetical protein